MYLCPNCGAEIRFDIKTQQMYCEHCESSFAPASLNQRGEADYNEASSGFFEAEIFSCPDCGGEITALPGAMADFCPYCGASVMLTARKGQIRKPARIIPFQKTKEDCKAAFTKYAKRSWFAPRAFSDKNSTDDFRGIYMPYWKYYIHVNSDFAIDKWEHLTKRTTNYRYYDQYRITGHAQSRASGSYHDAAANMADDVSEAIEPFTRKQEQNFHSAFMAGFYADMDDVPADVYGRTEAENGRKAIDSAIAQRLRREDVKGDPVSKINYNLSADAVLAMYPVWFMARRIGKGKNNTRVCYSAVNGQTGKVTGDLPVDMTKFALVWLILTAILTVLIGAVFTIRPMQLMADSCLIATISAILYYRGLRKVRKKEFRTGDLGFAVKNPEQIDPRVARKNERYRKRMLEQVQRTGGDPNSIPQVAPTENGCLTGLLSALKWVFILFFGFILLGVLAVWMDEASAVRASEMSRLFTGIGIFVVTILAIAGLFVRKDVKSLRSVHGSLWLMISVWICAVVRMLDPHADLPWYIASIAAGLACALSFVELLKVRNLLSTHPMPQFNREDKGGGANA